MGNNKKEVCGVYEIRNLVNNKVYVGSSVRGLKRKKEHFGALLKNKHWNCHLQYAFNKYGEENFKHTTIEKEVASENLIEREQFYMDLYQAADRRYGYNLCPAAGSPLGYKHTAETIEKYRKAKERGPYTFISPEGASITLDSFDAFKRRFGLNTAHLSRVERGLCHYHKGWRKFSKLEVGVPHIPTYVRGPHTFIDPKGTLVTRNSFASFAKEFKLSRHCLSQVEKGKNFNHRGWRKPNEEQKGVPCAPAHRPHTFINPQGEAITRDSFVAFKKEFGLSDSHLSRVEKGTRKHHKGWTKPK